MTAQMLSLVGAISSDSNAAKMSTAHAARFGTLLGISAAMFERATSGSIVGRVAGRPPQAASAISAKETRHSGLATRRPTVITRELYGTRVGRFRASAVPLTSAEF